MAKAQWRWLVGPLDMGGEIKAGMRHAIDNGAWPAFMAWTKGKRPTKVLDLAHARGAYAHVGRVNTAKRMDLVGKAGADSCDGATGAMFSDTIAPMDRARREVVIQRSQTSFDFQEAA